MRLIKLPADLMPLTDAVVDSFQYPENEAWSVQTDEKEQIVGGMKSLRRIWPLIRLIQALSPQLRDILRGYMWEEDGQLAGLTVVQRRGSTDVWIVGTVAVRPAYRRRGIARKLVQAALDLIRQHGGKKAILSVIDGNLPAYTLYESLGFEHYDSSIEFSLTPEQAPPAPSLPEGYVQSPLTRFDWRPRYELEKRICPENLLKYDPVEEGRFRYPAMMRVFLPLVLFAQGLREDDFTIHSAAEERVVARGGYDIPRRGKGVNSLRLRLDPDHPQLASYLVRYLLHEVMTANPGLRVELSVPRWMEAVVAAAQEAGFQRRMEYCRMGLEL
jgi:ribosomal protein S18 acetylase RimI-like enzyme